LDNQFTLGPTVEATLVFMDINRVLKNYDSENLMKVSPKKKTTTTTFHVEDMVIFLIFEGNLKKRGGGDL
jgi:hypothetical protein